jgi:hypothetical protein
MRENTHVVKFDPWVRLAQHGERFRTLLCSERASSVPRALGLVSLSNPTWPSLIIQEGQPTRFGGRLADNSHRTRRAARDVHRTPVPA